MAVASVKTTLAVHAVAAPVIFAGLSWAYFRWFEYTTPLQTAVVFVVVVILMDFFVVAPLILKSFDMFGSVLGTWLTFLLIFASTLAMGKLYRRCG